MLQCPQIQIMFLFPQPRSQRWEGRANVPSDSLVISREHVDTDAPAASWSLCSCSSRSTLFLQLFSPSNGRNLLLSLTYSCRRKGKVENRSERRNCQIEFVMVVMSCFSVEGPKDNGRLSPRNTWFRVFQGLVVVVVQPREQIIEHAVLRVHAHGLLLLAAVELAAEVAPASF